MGSRKEILKKSLGISEYPWSSDDDLDESTNPTNTDHGSLRRQQEPRTSTADMPGTSGLQSQSTSQQTPPRRSSSCSKMDRNLFWSMLNSPHQVPPNPPPTVNRPRMEPVQMPRIPVAPPNPSEREHYAIQRIITLRRLTRDLDERLATSATLNNILHGTPLPRGSANIQNPSRPYYPKKYHYPFRRSPTTRNLLACFARTGRGQVSHDPTTDEPLALTTHNAPITIRDGVNRDHHPMPSLHSHHNISFNNSEDDLDNPGPSTSNHAPTEEVNLTNDEPDAPPLTPPMNTSAMSLEEEIVEIDADDAPADQTIDLDDDNAQRFDYQPPAGDPNVASTSSDNAEAQEQQPPNQGVKRKRRNSDDNPEPFTVKEFNQNLLRLLECPVCLEWMEPPMSQCRRGHLVCARCRARLAACPVCRTTFSSVRNRAMEGVAEMLRYPCRHGCGRSVRQRRRAPHEDSCPRRAYACPAPACRDAPPLQRDMLPEHFQSRHLPLLKIGVRHKFTMKMNSEQHDHWILLALDQYFHLRVEVGLRVIVCVALIGPKCDAKRYLYQVTVDGHHNRKMVYSRAAHSDLESSFNMAKQDCFHLSREQALTFVRVKNRHSNVDKLIDLTVELSKVEVAEIKDDSDS